MTEALLKGDWQASESAELRRLALLPASAPLQWDELMVQPSYMHALDSLF